MAMEALVEADLIAQHMNTKGDEIPDKLATLVTEIANVYQANIKREAPVNKQKGGASAGTLQSSIRVENHGPLESRVFQDRNIAPYAIYVLKGTPAHMIRPKHKKALFWPGLKNPVKWARHPGTEANPFWDRGVQSSQSEKQANIDEFVEWLTSEG